ncbi:MAG: ATP-binding cassette domain-containing protein [SAR324 cluster bacterium]|nr:ATP-binding cassette domain-containing protein [SAR324 cluster bacterium]MCZ6842906.1 ATP-binding cassette domain-containing protein [SAR324 cluster bacterium]
MAAKADSILVTEGVSIRFGGLLALAGISLVMRPATITAIIGPNGAGKTTLFNCITGFYRPTEGRIIFRPDGRDVVLNRLPIHKIAQLGVARTYQNIRLFGQMSVLENLLVAQHHFVNHRLISGIFQTRSFRKSEAEAVEQAWFWLEFMGMEQLANQDAGTLPYGQQRRLEVARAMASRPRLICLDEPAAGLNLQESEELNQLILKLREEHGVSVLLIEHHMGVVMSISDHVVVLDHGEVISDGTTEQVQQDERVIKAYLGEEDAEALQSVTKGAG